MSAVPPTPDQLTQWPELAVLEGLAGLLAVVRPALVAATGELADEDFITELQGPTALQTCLVDAILNQLDSLETALSRYRDYVTAVDQRLIPPTTTLPF
jgi:hypothetical protein